jgi:hypothetical protein
MIRARFLAVALALAATGPVASAQTIQTTPIENTHAPDPAAGDDGLVFLPSYHFHLNMAHLSHESPRYNWDANYGGEFGIIAYKGTQLTFVANYQAILGEEFHPFDPNQGNYVIDGVLSTKVKGMVIAGVFHHLSRHLADRPKRPPVDWNMFGGRVGTRVVRGGTDIDAQLDLLGAILKTNVDYNWELNAGVRAHHRLVGTLGVIGAAHLREVGVNGTRNRGTQTGGRGEGGIRISGRAATVELYVAVERVIDPYPTEPGTATWASVGMRLLSP